MKATIKDVAKEAGVSTGTVDRVINRKGNVAPKTEKKVLEAVKKLNYKKSPIAKALVSSKNKIKIGVVFPYLEYYFWQKVFRGIEDIKEKLEPFGVEIIVETTKTYSIKEHLKAIDKLVKKDVKGTGRAGDVVKVSDGYARNMLIPKGMAVLATDKNIRTIEKQKAVLEEQKKEEKEKAEKLAETLSEKKINLKTKTGENGKLFGSITTMDI